MGRVHRSRFPNQPNRRGILFSACLRALCASALDFLLLFLSSAPAALIPYPTATKAKRCHPEARCLSAGPKDLNSSPDARARLPPVPPYRVPTRPCILGTAPWISVLPPSSAGSSIPSTVLATASSRVGSSSVLWA